MQLVKYEAARQALQIARSVDEVKDIRDKAEAMRAYAKQAKDFEMANWAAEIRIRAERKLGQMIPDKFNHGGDRKSKSHDETLKLADIGVTKSMSSRAQAIAAVPEEEFEAVIAEYKEATEELTSATIYKLTKTTHVSNNSGENEWYTPPKYVDAVRELFGEIDLDPASSKLANETVKANSYYDTNVDGLTMEWSGKVYMNPPYSQPEISQFCEKVASSYDSGEVTESVILVNNATETNWFQDLAYYASAICFVKGRIKYLDKTGVPANTPLQGQAFLYLGRNGNDFANVFQKFGFVVTYI